MTSRTRPLIALLAALAAVAAFWFLALEPKREEAAQLDGQIAAKQAELDLALEQVAGYEKARAAYPANYATVVRLGKAVPADDDVRSLMVQISAAAKRSGVGFELIDVGKTASSATPPSTAAEGGASAAIPGVTANAAGFSTLPMSLAFRGSYFELSSFLTRLERFVTVSNRRIDATGRLLMLQSISLVPDAKGFPHMRAQIEATSYLVPAAEPVTGAATAGGASTTVAGDPATGTTPSSASTTVTGTIE